MSPASASRLAIIMLSMRIAVGLAFLLLWQGASSEQIRQRLSRGDLAGAEADLSRALSASPGDWELLALLAELRGSQQRWQEAETALKRALEVASDRPEPYLLLARLYQSQQRLQPAQETLQTARSRLGEQPEILFQLALVAVGQRDFMKSLALLERIRTPQAPPEFWETLGRVHASLGNFSEAEKAYLELLQRRQDSIPVLRALSGFALKSGDTERGWEYMAEARRLAPNSPEVLFEFAQVSLVDGLVGEALGCARVLRLMEPEERSYVILLANALMAANEHNEARKLLEEAIARDPQDGESRLLLGVAHNRLGDFAAAQAQLEHARELLPDDTEVRYILGLVAYSQSQDQDALSHLTAVLEKKPDHGGAWLALGKLRLRQEQLPDAATALEKAAQLLPQDADAYFQLSRVYRQMGDNEKAQSAVQRYRQLKDLQVERDARAATLPFSKPEPQD